MLVRKARSSGNSRTTTRWPAPARRALSSRLRTLQHGDAVMASSDQPAVLFTAFRQGQEYAQHILNLGAARPAELVGLPEAEWRVVESTEAAQWGERGAPLAPPGRRNPASLGVSPPMHRYS